LFGGLIFYNDGITGLLYFLIPIALQRRPLTIWPKILNTRGESKLRKWCVFAGAAIILAFIALWYFPQADVPQLTGHEPDIGFMTYLHRLCSFPVNTLWAMMPWTLLLWAPFCAALITMDKNPLFGKIHRIFFLSLLVLIWLNPERRVRDLFLLMPLMATMIGTNYWILIRRYGYRMARIGSFIGWCLMIGSLFLAGFLFLKYHTPDWLQNLSVLQEIPSRFRPDPSASLVLFVPLAELGAAFFLGMLALILLRKKCILWLTATVLFCGISLSVWAVTTPQRLQNQPKHDFAAELKMSLKDQLPAGEPLYSSVYGLFAEGYYAGIPVRHIEARPYPDEQEQVYMISSDFPADSRRLWTKLHEIEYKRTRLGIYRGQLIRSDDNDDDI